jgi:signal transduction histidine kinase
LTRALAHQAMLAIQLMRLSQQSRQSAVMTERNRMARGIHDTLAQGFTGVIVQLEAATTDAASIRRANTTDSVCWE